MRWQRARVGVWLAAQTRVDLGVEPEPFPDPGVANHAPSMPSFVTE